MHTIHPLISAAIYVTLVLAPCILALTALPAPPTCGSPGTHRSGAVILAQPE